MRNSLRKREWIVFCVAICALVLLASQASTAQIKPGDSAAGKAFLKKLAAAAGERSHHAVRYDPAYGRSPYPGGDGPADTGGCTDEIIRAYRAGWVDLQEEVHQDVEEHFSA